MEQARAASRVSDAEDAPRRRRAALAEQAGGRGGALDLEGRLEDAHVAKKTAGALVPQPVVIALRALQLLLRGAVQQRVDTGHARVLDAPHVAARPLLRREDAIVAPI